MEINATLIVQAAFFCFLLVWLSNVLFKPMLALFDEREKRIQGARLKAEKLDIEARKQMEHVEAQIKIAYDEAKLLKNRLSNEADESRKAALEEARNESNAYLKQAQDDLAKTTDQVSAELRAVVQPLSDALMAKLGVSQNMTSSVSSSNPSSSGSNLGEIGA